MRFAPQSSPWSGPHPAWILALLFALPRGGVVAQGTVTLQRATSFVRAPEANATVLGSFPRGAALNAGPTRGAFRQVTINAWIFSASTEQTRRDGFDLRVRATAGENIRRTPNGRIVGRALEGALFNRVEVRGAWSRVTRDVWIPVSAVETAPLVVAPATSAARTDSGGSSREAERVTLAPGAVLRLSQGGPQGASILSEMRATAEEHSGDWVRVKVEGWVPASDLKTVNRGTEVTLADLRANPERFVGREVTWRLQFLALQTADQLRPEMSEGQPYLLTRGPLPEIGFVYVLIPTDQIARFRAMAPLTDLVVDVVIRAGRTRYLPNPVVELVQLR